MKIGVIGFVPPQIVQWDKSHLDGKATTIDIVDAANKHVPDLKKAGADIVVALCHSGIAGGERKGGEENAALHLAKVDGIDVILTGHQHFTFPGGKEFNNIPGVDVKAGTLHGKPAVMAGLLGQPSRPHRSRADEGWRRLEGREFPHRGASRSTTASTARSCRRSIPRPSSSRRRRPATMRR